MRVTVNTDKCIGSGLCALAAPEVFDQNIDDGVVLLVSDHPAAHLHPAVREAAGHCPAQVISLDEDG